MRVLNVHIRFPVSPEAVRITHIILLQYNNVFIQNNKNKTIIRVNNKIARRRKQNTTIWYTCFHDPAVPLVFSLNGQ